MTVFVVKSTFLLNCVFVCMSVATLCWNMSSMQKQCYVALSTITKFVEIQRVFTLFFYSNHICQPQTITMCATQRERSVNLGMQRDGTVHSSCVRTASDLVRGNRGAWPWEQLTTWPYSIAQRGSDPLKMAIMQREQDANPRPVTNR
jgi:hypothetical protein